MTQDELIEKTDSAISELVYDKVKLQKAYNYYNGFRDAEQFKYLEENFGIGNPTAVEFTPLIRKHVDALIGEYLGTPILPKISCKDEKTISSMTREKELLITKEVYNTVKQHLQNNILSFLESKDVNKLKDPYIQETLNNLINDLNNNFISQYEIAAQDVIQYIMQNRQTDFKTKLWDLIKDLLITGYTFYQPVKNNNNINLDILNPLDTFIDQNPNSPYIKDSYRVVVRKWLTKSQIINKYGKESADIYVWARKNGLISANDINNAKLNTPITREELTQIMVMFMAGILGKKPILTENVNYEDINSSSDLYKYIQLAYQYQIMGINADGTPIKKFNPSKVVNRKDFSTVLSRVLFGDTYNQN